MVNITHKQHSLRQAIACAVIQASDASTIQAVLEKKVPKGDVFEFSRAAGLLAIKKTSDVIPDCHPLPVEYAAFSFETAGLQIIIKAEVHTIYKTGVEVEAMHGAMIAALTMYDMLKPLDKALEIVSVKLDSKKGGKSDRLLSSLPAIKAAVIVCSDRAAKGEYEDVSGKLLMELLEQQGIATGMYLVVPDEIADIQQQVTMLQKQAYNLVCITGGTGLGTRDVTREALAPLFTRTIPGVMEAARNYGQQRTPMAMLSRGVAGFIDKTLVIAMPGSPKGVKETCDAIFPAVFHVLSLK